MSQAHVAILGAGQAGIACAAKLRALGYDAPITLIGNEDSPPYQRPPLSKAYLLGDIGADRLWLRAPEFYAEQRIDLRLKAPVTAIDTAARQITVAGERVGYSDLVLATGANPRRLPAAMGGDLPGVYTLRNLADVDALRPELVSGRRLVIIGGGYIGLEAAAVGAKLGLSVTLIEAAPRILQRVAAPATADYFRALHQSHGVTLIEGVGLDRIAGAGRATGVILADGREIAADFVLVGIGVTPATDLADAAGIVIDNGIACDGFGRTSAPHVWAAGDCASYATDMGRLRIESVGNAIDTGECVAENILGAAKPYVPKPWFWSDQYACKLQMAGLNAGYDATVVRPGAGDGQSVWYFRAGRLLAVDAMNDPRAYMVGKRLVDAGISPDPARVADAGVPVKDLLG